jgi:hypothetical protein
MGNEKERKGGVKNGCKLSWAQRVCAGLTFIIVLSLSRAISLTLLSSMRPNKFMMRLECFRRIRKQL